LVRAGWKYKKVYNNCVRALFFKFLLFICAYTVWVISSPPPPPVPLLPLLLPPTPSLPGRNYFALISNFVEGRV
jgi:hypothetical protein